LADVILIVDDEPDILSLARMILKGEGYHVIDAPDGETALQEADAKIPDLILLDIVLPGKTGFEVCKTLKSNVKTRHIPVVTFSVLGRDVDRKLAGEAGADGYFTKPFTPEALIAETGKHLDQARAGKFSRQLGVEHSEVCGKKILLEFDPSTAYERLIRDFALECASQGETVIVLTRRGSVIRQALEGDKGVEFVDVGPELMFSSLLDEHREGALSLVYDSLTSLVLELNPQAAYKSVQNAMQLLSEHRITAIFLLNPSAHEAKDVCSLRGLFSNQVTCGRQGITNVRLT
jgi:CheY-like chemotaxis protein